MDDRRGSQVLSCESTVRQASIPGMYTFYVPVTSVLRSFGAVLTTIWTVVSLDHLLTPYLINIAPLAVYLLSQWNESMLKAVFQFSSRISGRYCNANCTAAEGYKAARETILKSTNCPIDFNYLVSPNT